MFYKGKSRYVLSSALTEKGLQSYLPELVAGLGRVYILKGSYGSGKSTFIRLLGQELSEHGYEVEYWVSALDEFDLEGVHIPQKDVAVVDGSGTAWLEPRYPHVASFSYYLGDYLDQEAIQAQAGQIISHIEGREARQAEVVCHLQAAAQAYHSIKKGQAAQLNMQNLYQLAGELYAAVSKPLAAEKHYFASALTASGYSNYVDESSQGCRMRYILDGPAGSGKSTILGEIAARAREGGCSVEYYHSGLEADSLVMIILPALRTAVIDGGGLQLASKAGDKRIDTGYLLPAFESESALITHSVLKRDHEEHLALAVEKLEEAQRDLKALKRIYACKMDFSALNEKRLALLTEILA